MALIKELKIGNASIQVCSTVTPEENKRNLRTLYDVVNQIADRQRASGKSVDDWFYDKHELDRIKNDPSYTLLG